MMIPLRALKRVFGLVGICPHGRMEDRDYDKLKKHVVAYMDKVYPDKKLTFKVVARRARQALSGVLRSRSIVIWERQFWMHFRMTHVDVHKPDVMLHVEVRNEIYVYSQIIPGAGGMPVRNKRKVPCFFCQAASTARLPAI